MLKGFKELVSRGNVLDGVDFQNLFLNLSGKHYATLAEAKAAGAATLNYGVFLNTVIDFLIVAFVIYLVTRQLARFKKPEPAAAPTTRPRLLAGDA